MSLTEELGEKTDLNDELKNWLDSPPEAQQTFKKPQQNLGDTVLVKSEPYVPKTNLCKIADSSSRILNRDSIKKSFVLQKNFACSKTKEEPFNDINVLFSKTTLHYEKERFHQDVLNKILQNIDTIETQDIEKYYIEHLRSVVGIEVFSCSWCSYQTIHKENLRSHLIIIHKEQIDTKWLICLLCDYKTVHLHEMKKHQSKHKHKIAECKPQKNKKPIQRYECDLCTFESKSSESLGNHKSTHRDPDNSNRFLCYLCNYGNSNKTNLARHLLAKHEIVTKRANQIKQLQCDVCEYKCNTTQYLKRHLLSHKSSDEVTMLTCTYCDFKTKYRMSLNYHIKNHKLTDEQLRCFMCEICSKRFKQKAKLDLHIITHKSINEVSEIFKCPTCHFQAKIKRNLEMHLAVHKKPEFVCDVCGHQSKRKDAHNRHKLTHNKTANNAGPNFKCSLCSYETHIKYYLKKHFRKHSTDWNKSSTTKVLDKETNKS